MKSLTHFLEKYASWKSILILIGLFIFVNAFVFPMLLDNPNNIPLDLQFSYSSEKAYQLLSNFSAADLQKYKIIELTVDVVYPIIYTLLLSFLIFKINSNAKLALFPFLILIADYLENTGIVILISNFPKELNSIVSITSLLTSLKWILVISCVLLIIFSAVRRLFMKKQQN